MFILELLGTPSLRGDARAVPVAARQRRPLGLLAILALGGRQGLARERIEAYLWSESSGPLARHALDQTVYAIRRALDADLLHTTGGEFRLNPNLLRVDVWEFDEAIHRKQWGEAVSHYKGALLEGMNLGGSRELESWLDRERGRLLGEYQAAVECLASIASEIGDHSQSVNWYKRLANSDPLSARATKKLMLALAAAGDRAGAVKHAHLYRELVRQQLNMEPDSEVDDLVRAFSRPGANGSQGRLASDAPNATSSRPLDAPLPTAVAHERNERGWRALSPHNALRTRHSRIAAAVSLAALSVLLIGAVTTENRHRRDHRPTAAESTARSISRKNLPGARDAYRRALAAWSDGSREGLDTAVAYFSRATELDDQYAEAYAALADAYVMLGYFGYRPRDATFPKAKDAALRSIQLDSTLASAHPALAYELSWERDFPRADAEFRKAIALDPTHASPGLVALDPTYAAAHQWYGILLMILSQKPETVATRKPAATQSPYSLHDPVIEITFEKWFTTYPAMTGNSSYGPGSVAGAVLSRIDDGVFTHLIARYELTDPGGVRSFKTVLQGKASDSTGEYTLDGIVTWGWMTGAHVQVIFERTTPCRFGTQNVCFHGTLRLQRR